MILERQDDVPWRVTDEKVAEAVKTIARVAAPARIFLFGSFVHKTKVRSRDSDVDILVVLHDEPKSSRAESVRLRKALSHVRMPIDILVVSEDRLRELGDRPGLIYREILHTGKVVYDAA